MGLGLTHTTCQIHTLHLSLSLNLNPPTYGKTSPNFSRRNGPSIFIATHPTSPKTSPPCNDNTCSLGTTMKLFADIVVSRLSCPSHVVVSSLALNFPQRPTPSPFLCPSHSPYLFPPPKATTTTINTNAQKINLDRTQDTFFYFL